jgi:hypothetical protein
MNLAFRSIQVDGLLTLTSAGREIVQHRIGKRFNGQLLTPGNSAQLVINSDGQRHIYAFYGLSDKATAVATLKSIWAVWEQNQVATIAIPEPLEIRYSVVTTASDR